MSALGRWWRRWFGPTVMPPPARRLVFGTPVKVRGRTGFYAGCEGLVVAYKPGMSAIAYRIVPIELYLVRLVRTWEDTTTTTVEQWFPADELQRLDVAEVTP